MNVTLFQSGWLVKSGPLLAAKPFLHYTIPSVLVPPLLYLLISLASFLLPLPILPLLFLLLSSAYFSFLVFLFIFVFLLTLSAGEVFTVVPELLL